MEPRWLPANNWVALEFLDILFLPDVCIIPIERLGSISECIWVEGTTLVKPNSKSLLAYFPIASHPYLMQFHFLLAKVGIVALFGQSKGIDWVLLRWSSVKDAPTKCLTSHKKTGARCESFVGDSPNPQLLICTFHFYMVQILPRTWR